jgi:hypothetical protein
LKVSPRVYSANKGESPITTNQLGSPLKQPRLGKPASPEEAEKVIFLESSRSDSGRSCDAEKPKIRSSDKYLIKHGRKELIQRIDNTIKRKRDEDAEGYELQMKNKAIMDCLKPKRGKEEPCEIKIRALKFLVEAYEAQQAYAGVDFEAELYRARDDECQHDGKAEREEEYERKLWKCINIFRDEIPSKSREKFLLDKSQSKRDVLLGIIQDREDEDRRRDALREEKRRENGNKFDKK